MTTPDQPARTTGTCRACGGPIRYWGRLASDDPPRTTAIDDRDRWSHDNTADWLHHPQRHRAQPVEQETMNQGTES